MPIARSPARRRPLPVILGTAALLAGLPITAGAAPAPPRAAPTGAWTGTTVVRLRADVARRLGVQRVSVSPAGDASGRGRIFRLAVTDGSGSSALRVQHARTAGLRLTSGRRSVALTDLRLTAGKRGQLSGRVDGGRSRSLFGLGKATATPTGGNGWRLRATALTPTASGARALRKALGGGRIGSRPIGTIETRLTPAPARDGVTPPASLPPATPTPAPPVAPTPVPPTDPSTPLPPTPDSAWRVGGSETHNLTTNGGTEWAIRGSWLRYLNAGKGSVVTSGVEQVDGGTYGFPLGQAGLYSPTEGWLLPNTGSLTFLYPAHGIEISLADPWVFLGPQPRLSVVLTNRSNASGAPVGGGASTGDGLPHRIDFGVLDLSAVTPTVNGTNVSWDRVPVLLTAAGAEPFLAYKAGEAFGSINVRASTVAAPID